MAYLITVLIACLWAISSVLYQKANAPDRTVLVYKGVFAVITFAMMLVFTTPHWPSPLQIGVLILSAVIGGYLQGIVNNRAICEETPLTFTAWQGFLPAALVLISLRFSLKRVCGILLLAAMAVGIGYQQKRPFPIGQQYSVLAVWCQSLAVVLVAQAVTPLTRITAGFVRAFAELTLAFLHFRCTAAKVVKATVPRLSRRRQFYLAVAVFAAMLGNLLLPSALLAENTILTTTLLGLEMPFIALIHVCMGEATRRKLASSGLSTAVIGVSGLLLT